MEAGRVPQGLPAGRLQTCPNRQRAPQGARGQRHLPQAPHRVQPNLWLPRTVCRGGPPHAAQALNWPAPRQRKPGCRPSSPASQAGRGRTESRQDRGPDGTEAVTGRPRIRWPPGGPAARLRPSRHPPWQAVAHGDLPSAAPRLVTMPGKARRRISLPVPKIGGAAGSCNRTAPHLSGAGPGRHRPCRSPRRLDAERPGAACPCHLRGSGEGAGSGRYRPQHLCFSAQDWRRPALPTVSSAIIPGRAPASFRRGHGAAAGDCPHPLPARAGRRRA